MHWLARDEWRHVALSSRLRENQNPPLFGQAAGGRLWIRENSGEISGALHISRLGVVLPVLESKLTDNGEVSFLKRIVVTRKERVFSVIGMENTVLEIERLFERIPPDAQSYLMFTRHNLMNPLVESRDKLTIHRASPSDSELLWPLEKAYQIEEVIRTGHQLYEAPARRHFINTLKEQEVYYAALDGTPVAKAGTNARGIGYDQIGGVFVSPAYRNRGFAQQVLTHLLKSIFLQGRKPCLFVKKSNLPALGLYRSLGFQERGTFRISYWTA
jgi:predicted GNAT family acetyltransferase